MSRRPPDPSRPRRELAVAVAGCLAGAGLALLAARRDWAVRVTPRRPPLSPLRESVTGADLVPWLSAAGLVSLAAAVALVATRGRGRVVVASVAAACGAAVAAGAGYGLAVAGRDGRIPADALWPVACLAGGVLVLAAGVLTVVRGRTWPSMGARYERAAPAARAASGGPGAEADPESESARLWDALDAGDDPTASPPQVR